MASVLRRARSGDRLLATEALRNSEYHRAAAMGSLVHASAWGESSGDSADSLGDVLGEEEEARQALETAAQVHGLTPSTWSLLDSADPLSPDHHRSLSPWPETATDEEGEQLPPDEQPLDAILRSLERSPQWLKAVVTPILLCFCGSTTPMTHGELAAWNKQIGHHGYYSPRTRRPSPSSFSRSSASEENLGFLVR